VIHARPGLDLGAYGALAVHPATGRLHAAYYDATYGLLMYARRDPGGAWVRRVIDASMDVGRYASLAVNAAGVVHIAYRDGATRRLKVAIGTP
ncbi:MAG: hypothetical protein HY293_11470, partial [Planctomycetes bacterium]|nr:hypothetical protein [Planctomycetota bacterium]